MFELNSWFKLSEDPYEVDVGALDSKVLVIKEMISRWDLHTLRGRVESINGFYYLIVSCNANRRRSAEIDLIDEVVGMVVRQLPGSYGLIYERDDEAGDPPGMNSFRVTVLARGSLSVREDPFLSPVTPTIED